MSTEEKLVATYNVDEAAAYIHQTQMQSGLKKPNGQRFDAGETLAMARQLEAFEVKVYETEYPDSIWRRLIPVDTSVPSGAEVHTYRMFDDTGEAVIIDSYGDDLPVVESTGKEFSQAIKGIGAAIFVGVQELRAAAMMGLDIDARKAVAARKLMERKVDKLAALGVANLWTGFANSSSVPLLDTGSTPALHGSWRTATVAQILSDISIITSQVFNQTLGVHGNPDNDTTLTIALPNELWTFLATTASSTLVQTTIMEYVLKANPMVKEFVSWGRLNKADADGTHGRVVAYHKDPDVLEAVVSQEFEMLALQQKSMGYQIPCHMRYGGVKIRYPLAMVYADDCDD